LTSLPPKAWRKIEVGDVELGPQFVKLVATRVMAGTYRGRISPEGLLVVVQGTDKGGAIKRYYLK
jgi:hypothetical protein